MDFLPATAFDCDHECADAYGRRSGLNTWRADAAHIYESMATPPADEVPGFIGGPPCVHLSEAPVMAAIERGLEPPVIDPLSGKNVLYATVGEYNVRKGRKWCLYEQVIGARTLQNGILQKKAMQPHRDAQWLIKEWSMEEAVAPGSAEPDGGHRRRLYTFCVDP